MSDVVADRTERLTPQRRRQLTRDALIDAAVEVFAERGFEGASLEEIAERAGFTRGAIYKNFDGKVDLFFAVNDRINDASIERFAETLGEGNPLDTDMSVIAQRWHEQAPDREQYALILEFNLYALRHPEVMERVIAQRHANVQRIQDFMSARAESAGLNVKVSTSDLAHIFGITADAFSEWSLFDPDATRLYQVFLQLLVDGMLASS
jgi:AcrR family transcriptional regulator